MTLTTFEFAFILRIVALTYMQPVVPNVCRMFLSRYYRAIADHARSGSVSGCYVRGLAALLIQGPTC